MNEFSETSGTPALDDSGSSFRLDTDSNLENQGFMTLPENSIPKEVKAAMYSEMRGVSADVDDEGKYFVADAKNAKPLMENSIVKLQELSRSFNGEDTKAVVLATGDEVVRITAAGENRSPYFIQKSQLESFSSYSGDTNTYKIDEAKMRDTLALPHGSKLEDVQFFTCKNDIQVFSGTIAPALENGERKNGGGEQLVILNRQEKLGEPVLTIKVE